MRIGLVCGYPLSETGGTQQHVRDLYNYLKNKGHHVRIISPYIDKKKKEKDVIYIGKCNTINIEKHKWFLSKTDKNEIKKILKREKFGVLHFHDFNIFATFDIIEESASKNIITFHSILETKIFKFVEKFIEYIFNKYSKKINGIIFVSDVISNYFQFIKKNYSGPIEIIPNGIDIKRFNNNYDRIKKFSDGKINILFVGRLSKNKGLKYLIDSFEKIKKKNENVRLMIVGDGIEKKNFEKTVKKKKLKDVVFIGKVKNERLPYYYATADIFCSPSLYESFGIIVLEAMACGKPVVAFNNNGYKNLLKDKGSQFLSELKDVNDLTKKIEVLINDKKLRDEMGEWGLEEAKKYTWDIVGEKIEDFYNKVLNNEKSQ